MIVFLIKIREELMINMELKNQNNIISIIDNNGEKVRLNKYLELSFNKMEVLMNILEMDLVLNLEMVLVDFNFFKLVLECFIIKMVQEDIVVIINNVTGDKNMKNKNL